RGGHLKAITCPTLSVPPSGLPRQTRRASVIQLISFGEAPQTSLVWAPLGAGSAGDSGFAGSFAARAALGKPHGSPATLPPPSDAPPTLLPLIAAATKTVRRFCARPAAVRLSPTGLVSPNPTGKSRLHSTPCEMSQL